VAVSRKNNRFEQENKSSFSQIAVIFWLVFFIVIISIFLANRDIILENFNLLKSKISSPENIEPAEEPVVTIQPKDNPNPDIQLNPQVSKPQEPSVSKPQEPSQEPSKPQEPSVKPQEPKPETRDRAIYFTYVDNEGQILRSKVNRKIAVSDSPLHDALTVMLAGPTSDELNKGIINLIPGKTRLLSAIIRGNTAYLNFNEDFQFNTFGVEGYAAQLRQIIWTATEFATVKDVQILIEGRRVDYLGEGIWIGSPLGRQSI
jgi:spore germination protein GerM